MTFRLEFATDNAAFEGRPLESARLLSLAAARVAQGETEGVLLDWNGNTVGAWSFEDDE